MHASSSAKATLIADLEREIEELQKEFGEHEDPKVTVSKHIKLLHRYNEAKDAAQVASITFLPSPFDPPHFLQILIGKLAAHKETTIRQMHEEYGLTDDD
ncbi:hypothetical protein BJ322DRAFT_1107648 [Thelephora terrestris]|uniref:Uncharacterized protein n=1 Tax=Thelephora terrestris TaxID=56493 RepID=A0A9P6HET4_9AGAM|nr:hypothetical protein BJ322DRAFT_1107648 [Thelephora terrestris]